MAASDFPPNSRLFLLCSPLLTDADVRREFEKFGRIDDCWVVNDRKTNKSKGVCYIKFSKASEACLAMEEMDNKPLGNDPRPIKVKMACPVGVGNKRESDNDTFERLRCAFVRVPKKLTEDGKLYDEEHIRREFEKFGNVIGCNFTKSGRNCYVTFEKPSQASAAIENCDRDFAPVFVDPEKSSRLRKRDRCDDHFRSDSPPEEHYRRPGLVPTPPPSMHHGSSNFGYRRSTGTPPPQSFHFGKSGGGILATPGASSYEASNGYYDSSYRPPPVGSHPPPPPMKMEDFMNSGSVANNPSRCPEIYIKINYPLTREAAFRLCNLVPGLDTLELVRTTGEGSQLHTIFLVRYASPVSASWAWEKLQDLEYPPGCYIRVRYADQGFPRDWDLNTALNSQPMAGYSSDQSSLAAAQMEALQNRFVDHNSSNNSNTSESSILSSLVSTLSAAAAASSGPSTSTLKMHPFGHSECSVKLSYPRAMLPKITPYESRLFFLSTQAISCDVLQDAFSSFGDLINVYFISGKNCGYAMYATKRAAEVAMATLNSAILDGAKLKGN